MPRKLPWLSESAPKSSKQPSKPPTSRPAPPRSSSPDLVDSDLNPLHPSTPPPPPKPPTFNSSPTSPAHLTPPPPFSPIRPSDLVYRMVEDEFLATAKLYTRHLHREAYMEAKRRAKARGGEVLKGLGRGTDGKTDRGRRGEMEDEARVRRKREREGESGEEGERDGEEWLDPQLAGLMKGREGARVVCRPSRLAGKKVNAVKGDTRASRGFGRSPGTVRTYDAETLVKGVRNAKPAPKRTQVEVEEEDRDDLDAIPHPHPETAPKPVANPAATTSRSKPTNTQRPEPKGRPAPSSKIFKPFINPPKPATTSTSTSHKPRPSVPTPESDETPSPATKHSKPKSSGPFSDDATNFLGDRTQRDSVAEFLARKKAARERKAMGKSGGGFGSAKMSGGKGVKVQDKEKEYDDVPTFMI